MLCRLCVVCLLCRVEGVIRPFLPATAPLSNSSVFGPRPPDSRSETAIDVQSKREKGGRLDTRRARLCVIESRHPGEHLPLEHLQRGPSSSGDVRHLALQTRLMHCRYGVTTANDRHRPSGGEVSQSLRH
jgi:hypothetical protein